MMEDQSTPDGETSSMYPKLKSCRVRSSRGRNWQSDFFRRLSLLCAATSVVVLVVIIFFIGMIGRYALLNLPDPKGISQLSSPVSEGILRSEFFTNVPSDKPRDAGLGPAILGTLCVCGICVIVALPLGFATAILLEEYRPRRKSTRIFQSLVRTNITNLAGIPSVVYGVFGLTAFVFLFGAFGSHRKPALEIGVQHFDQFRTVYRGPRGEDFNLLIPVSDFSVDTTVLSEGMTAYTSAGEPVKIRILDNQLSLPQAIEQQKRSVLSNETPARITKKRWYHLRIPFGRGALASGLTLAMVILPVVVIASQEALRTVPLSLREAAYGLGATPWQVVRNVSLPAAIGSMTTGAILAIGRAVGEAAPILIVAGSVYVSVFPNNLMDPVVVVPTQIYSWAADARYAYHELAAGGVIVLLIALLLMNATAVLIRQYTQKPNP